MSDCPQGLDRRSFWLPLGGVLGSLCGARAQGQEVLELPLVMSMDPRQPYGQLMARIQDEVAEAAGIVWRRSQVPFARLVAMAERGEAMGWGMTRTAEREAVLAFSQPVARGPVWVLTRPNKVPAPGLGGLRGLAVCMRRGEHYGPALEAMRDTQFQVVLADGDPLVRLRMVASGRCDAVLVTRLASLAGMRRMVATLPLELQGLQVNPEPVDHETLHFSVNKQSALAQQLPRLDRAIRERMAAIQALVEAE